MNKLKKAFNSLFKANKIENKNMDKKISTKSKPIKSEVKILSCAILEFLGFIEIKHIIHTGEPSQLGRFHLAEWLPVFQRNKINVVVLVRNEELYNFVRKQWPKVICIYAKGVTEVDRVLDRLKKAKNIFYLSNTGNLIHTLRRNDFNHIFLGHGDSNKYASAHKFFRVYDEIWVSGQAHVDRFQNAGFNIEHLIFRKIGRPNLEKLVNLNKKTLWYQREPKTAIIAPTWEGVIEDNNGSSVPYLMEIVQILLRFDYKIKIKLHPATGRRNKDYLTYEEKLKELSKQIPNELEVIEKEIALTNVLECPTICLGDNSAAITEFLSCYCPILIYKPEKHAIESHSNMDYDEFCYEWQFANDFEKVISNLEEGKDPKSENRISAQEYYLGLSFISNNAFINELKK